MTSLVIRPASISDLSSIVKIRVEALTEEELCGFIVPGDSFYSSIKKLREMWDRSNKLKNGMEIFVADWSGKIVGFIVFNMDDHDDNIDNLVVAKKEQGKGIGEALVNYVENLAKSRGLDAITTDTTENAKGIPWKAYGFWKNMGYEDFGKRVTTSYDFKVIPLIKRLK
jgi:ribosomal protein S18 acetylase RimI-like enzyme